MRQKFFTKTIQSDFIKSLLYNTPLPIYKTVQSGDYLVKGYTYIFNRSIIKCTQSGYLFRPLQKLTHFIPGGLGQFILDISHLDQTLSSVDITQYAEYYLPRIANGQPIINQTYYLLGSYNLRYDLVEGDPDYPIFDEDSITGYLAGQIVQHLEDSGDYYLYRARKNIDPESTWNIDDWRYINSNVGPYKLIYCTRSGITNGIPSGAAYTVLQESEPVVISTSDVNEDLNPNMYYCLVDIPNQEICLIYNENVFTLKNTVAQWYEYNSYIPERYYTTFTNRFDSATDYYDSDTHKRFGDLLRFYKNIYHINLMPYYNCWDGSYLLNHQIFENELVKISDPTFKLLKVPIKFNQKYTIAIDCDSKVYIVPAFIKFNDFLKVKVGMSNEIDLSSLLDNSQVITYNSTSFNNPFIFEITNTSNIKVSSNDLYPSVDDKNLTVSELLEKYERDLYLIIQLPLNNDSSVVVLEGDYLNTKINNIFDIEHLDQISQKQLDNMLTGPLSLLQLNDKITYPFADRLIEYILQNVITERDEIGEDILRVRNDLQGYLQYATDQVAWDDYLRITIYDLLKRQYGTKKLDISGYVDKDAEEYLSTLQ